MGLWRNPDYRWWLTGDTAGVLGMSIRSFALPLVAFALTDSTSSAGLLLTVAIGTSVVATPFGGVLVDRYDRRTMIRAHAVTGVAAWGTITALLATGQLTYPLLFGLACVGALGAGLFGYATDAALRSIATTTEYPSAMATNQGRDAAVQLIAGPLGGVLYAVRVWAPFATALAGYAVAGLATLGIRADLRPPSRERRGAMAELREAFTWLAGRRRVRAFFVPLLLVNFGANGATIGFELALIDRGHTPVEIGFVSAAVAVSALLGALAAGGLVQKVPTGALTIVALGWVPIALLPTVVWHDYGVMLGCLAASFVLLPSVNASLLGYLFALTPVELQGRAQALLVLVLGGVQALGPLTVGALLGGPGFGAMAGVLVGALALGALLAARSPAIRSIPRPDGWQDAPL